MPAKNETKVIKEIISRYGNTLDLKSSPYLIVEIIRQYASRLGGPAADCLPPGGPPPEKFDPLQLVRELNVRIADVNRLSRMLERTLNPKIKKAAKQKTK